MSFVLSVDTKNEVCCPLTIDCRHPKANNIKIRNILIVAKIRKWQKTKDKRLKFFLNEVLVMFF